MNNFYTLAFLPLLLFFALSIYSHRRRRQRLQARLRILGAYATPQMSIDWIAGIVRPLASPREQMRLRRRMQNAGWGEPRSVNYFLLAKLGMFLIALLIAWITLDIDIRDPFSQPLSLLKLLALLFITVRLPDWWLSERIRLRQRHIRSGIPHMLDLLTVCADAGLNLDAAMSRTANEIATHAPEMAAELRLTSSELLILADRNEALRRLGSRSDVEDLKHLSGVLIQSMQFGTPLSEAMRTIAADCRARDIAALEEKAGKLAASIGIPLIVFILFPLVVMMTAPAVVNLLRTMDKVGT